MVHPPIDGPLVDNASGHRPCAVVCGGPPTVPMAERPLGTRASGRVPSVGCPQRIDYRTPQNQASESEGRSPLEHQGPVDPPEAICPTHHIALPINGMRRMPVAGRILPQAIRLGPSSCTGILSSVESAKPAAPGQLRHPERWRSGAWRLPGLRSPGGDRGSGHGGPEGDESGLVNTRPASPGVYVADAR